MSFSLYECPWREKEEIWELADQVRQEYYCSRLPVDSELIAERLGLFLHPLPMRDDLRAYLDIRGKTIYINTKHLRFRRLDNILRFTIAHEIGHYILHQDLLRAFTPQTVEEYLKFYENMPLHIHDNYEWQANEFAGRLIVPSSKLRLELDNYLTGLTAEQIQLLNRFLDDIKQRFANRLSKLFQVTRKVIIIRLEREELWPPDL